MSGELGLRRIEPSITLPEWYHTSLSSNLDSVASSFAQRGCSTSSSFRETPQSQDRHSIPRDGLFRSEAPLLFRLSADEFV